MTLPAPLPRILFEPILRTALSEDLARAGDLTSEAVIDADAQAEAAVVFRSAGRVCGLQAGLGVFDLLDQTIDLRERVAEGTDVEAGTVVARLSGSARTLLTGERVALNLVGRLSGIATATARLVRAIEGTAAHLTETRKTTPGLRALEKYATRVGGARNHRFGLDDAVMIKDNHIAIAGSIGEAVRRARAAIGHLVKVEVEVDTLDQLDEALSAGADVILLDNMTTAELGRAVDRNDGAAVLEASGGITPETVRSVAETGVDVLSLGWLTHSAPALDVALDILAPVR